MPRQKKRNYKISASMIKEKIERKLTRKLMSEILSTDLIDVIKEQNMPFQQMMAFFRCATMEVETKFKVLNEEFSLKYDRNPIESIKTRIKSPESILNKLKRRNLPLTVDSIVENLNDIAGVRVICSFPEDIYLLAECLLKQDDITLIEIKDYIQQPKCSGYRSLHLIVEVPIFLAQEKKPVRVEVQLRTIGMDFWASLEHKLMYKKSVPEDVAATLSQELLDCANISASLDLRMQKIRNQLAQYEDEP